MMKAQKAIDRWRTTALEQTYAVWVDEMNGARCAMGALAPLDACFQNMEASEWLSYHCTRLYGITMEFEDDDTAAHPVRCPAGDLCSSLELFRGESLIMHLNDCHMLSFKEIADLAERRPQLFFLPAEVREMQRLVAPLRGRMLAA